MSEYSLDHGFVCPECRESLIPTPSGYWTCFRGHTKLLTENQCREIKSEIFEKEEMPKIRAQQRREAKKKREAKEKLLAEAVLCYPTSAKGVYRIEDSDDLYIETKAKRKQTSELEVLLVSQSKKRRLRKGKRIRVRPLTDDELTKRIERGDFAKK